MNIELADIITIVGTLGGFEAIKWGIRSYLNRKTDARKEDAAADALELDNEKNQVGWLEERIAQRDMKIDALYVELRNVQNERLQLIYEKHALELELKEAVYNKCDVYDCQNREPPRGSVFKKEIKDGTKQ